MILGTGAFTRTDTTDTTIIPIIMGTTIPGTMTTIGTVPIIGTASIGAGTILTGTIRGIITTTTTITITISWVMAAMARDMVLADMVLAWVDKTTSAIM